MGGLAYWPVNRVEWFATGLSLAFFNLTLLSFLFNEIFFGGLNNG